MGRSSSTREKTSQALVLSPSRWGWAGAAQDEVSGLCRWPVERMASRRESQETGSRLAGGGAPPTVLCPFHDPWTDKARNSAREVAWVEGLLFVLQEQQEPFSSTAERHIPTGSLMNNKNNNTILHCVWFLPFQPAWTRRPLLPAFVPVSSWVARRGSVGRREGRGGRAGLQSPRACWLYGLSHLLDVFTLYLAPSFIKGE